MNSYVTVEITGKYVKRFVRSLYKKNIRFYSLDFKLKYVCATISYQDYLKIKELKTIYKVRIINYKGLIKYKQLFSIYKIFIFSIMLGFLLLFVLTNTIFDIDVIHDKKDVRLFIQEQLNLYGIKKFQFVKSFDENEKIASKILTSNRNKLEWLEIERVGTKYIVRVEERIIKTEKDKCSPRNIIAKKTGIIMNITSSKGEVIKTVNDYVKKGDILISGIITKNDEEKNRVCAEGKVYAETWYQVIVEVPYNYKETIYTKEYKKNISFTIFNKRYALFKDYNEFITSEKTLKSNVLPFKISLENNQKIINIDQIYTNEELDLKAFQLAKEKILTIVKEENNILLEKKLKTTPKNSTIEMVIFFKVKEDITLYQDIEENG